MQLAIEGGNPVRKREEFLVFGQPYIEKEEIEEVVKTLESCWIGTGPKVAQFEEMFRKYVKIENAAAVNSCTAALHLSMVALNLKPGDEVITTPMTFCATANAILHAGAKPVFVDIDRQTLNIMPKNIERAVTERTKVILPVHFAGRPCDLESILAIANKRGLKVVEDAAHALGAEYHGKKIGSIGDFTCFSFYPNKNITTIEGGMVTSRDENLINKIKILALHGMSKDAWSRFSDAGYKHYSVGELGFKYNMTDVQASIGIHQLAKIENWHKRRVEIWKKYDREFSDLPIQLPLEEEKNTRHARHLYTLILKTEKLIKNRDWVLEAIQSENIGVGVHYTALHIHPFYQNLGYTKGQFPNTEYVGERTMSIPLSAKLTDKDVEDVITAVRKVINCCKK